MSDFDHLSSGFQETFGVLPTSTNTLGLFYDFEDQSLPPLGTGAGNHDHSNDFGWDLGGALSFEFYEHQSMADITPVDIWSQLEAYSAGPSPGSEAVLDNTQFSIPSLDSHSQEILYSENDHTVSTAADVSSVGNDSTAASQSTVSEALGISDNLWPSYDADESCHTPLSLPHTTAFGLPKFDGNIEKEADTDESDEDSEYCPSPARPCLAVPVSTPSALASRAAARSTSRKERTSPYFRLPASASSSSPGSSTAPLSTARPRNTVLSPAERAKYDGRAPPMPADGRCPVCQYVQRSLRETDFVRHFRTHLQNHREFVCCGIPLEVALAKDAVLGSLEAHTFNGYELVGGCWQTFSRRDAYLRHLRKSRHWADTEAPWMAGTSVR